MSGKEQIFNDSNDREIMHLFRNYMKNIVSRNTQKMLTLILRKVAKKLARQRLSTFLQVE